MLTLSAVASPVMATITYHMNSGQKEVRERAEAQSFTDAITHTKRLKVQ